MRRLSRRRSASSTTKSPRMDVSGLGRICWEKAKPVPCWTRRWRKRKRRTRNSRNWLRKLTYKPRKPEVKARKAKKKRKHRAAKHAAQKRNAFDLILAMLHRAAAG